MSYRSASTAAESSGHPILAAMLAGPLYFTGMGIALWLTDPEMVIAPDENVLLLLPIFLFHPLVILVGAVLAIVPDLLGNALMRWLGRHNVGMRLPPAWALVGGGAAGTITMVVASQEPAIVVGMTFTGAISALICRMGIHWDEEEPVPLSDARRPAICAP